MGPTVDHAVGATMMITKPVLTPDVSLRTDTVMTSDPGEKTRSETLQERTMQIGGETDRMTAMAIADQERPLPEGGPHAMTEIEVIAPTAQETTNTTVAETRRTIVTGEIGIGIVTEIGIGIGIETKTNIEAIKAEPVARSMTDDEIVTVTVTVTGIVIDPGAQIREAWI